MTTVLALIVGYFGLLLVLALVVRPYRAKLYQLADDLVRDYADDDVAVRLIERYRATATSWGEAGVKLFGYLSGMFKSRWELDETAEAFMRDHPNFLDDPRVAHILKYHLLSVAAVSPVLGALAIVARIGMRLVIRARYGAEPDPGFAIATAI